MEWVDDQMGQADDLATEEQAVLFQGKVGRRVVWPHGRELVVEPLPLEPLRG